MKFHSNGIPLSDCVFVQFDRFHLPPYQNDYSCDDGSEKNEPSEHSKGNDTS